MVVSLLQKYLFFYPLEKVGQVGQIAETVMTADDLGVPKGCPKAVPF